MAKSVRNESNEVSRTVYCSVKQSARIKAVADADYGGNVSRAILGRFEEIDELTILPEVMREKVAELAKAAGQTNRAFVINAVVTAAFQPPAGGGAGKAKRAAPK